MFNTDISWIVIGYISPYNGSNEIIPTKYLIKQ